MATLTDASIFLTTGHGRSHVIHRVEGYHHMQLQLAMESCKEVVVKRRAQSCHSDLMHGCNYKHWYGIHFQSHIRRLLYLSTCLYPMDRSATMVRTTRGTAQSRHGTIEEGGQFPPERDRYHLYLGLFCPFAHRVNAFRHLMGLQEILPVSIVRPYPSGDLNTGSPG